MSDSRLEKRNDRFGTALVNSKGVAEKVLTRCPHCGMVDYRFMNQSSRSAHFCNWTIGGVSRYQCGKCREFFRTLTIQVPEGMDAMELYEIINSLPDYLTSRPNSKKGDQK